MITKYYSNSHQGNITPVEISKESKTGVWIHGNRLPKSGYGHSYHDTWDEAYENLVRDTQSRIDQISGEVVRHQEWLGKIEALMTKVKELKKP